MPRTLVPLTAVVALACASGTPSPVTDSGGAEGVPPSAGTSAAPVQAAEPPGRLLDRGVSLAYASNGREQQAWLIDSVYRGIAHAGRTGCVRIWIRRGGPTAPVDPRFVCRGGDTLFAWSATAGAWRADRPVGPGMRLTVPQSSGGRLVYETAETGERNVGGERVPYVATTILTVDTAGKVVRRLRERYAVALVTALDGVFEVPDSTPAGRWREHTRFELMRIERPMPR